MGDRWLWGAAIFVVGRQCRAHGGVRPLAPLALGTASPLSASAHARPPLPPVGGRPHPHIVPARRPQLLHPTQRPPATPRPAAAGRRPHPGRPDPRTDAPPAQSLAGRELAAHRRDQGGRGSRTHRPPASTLTLSPFPLVRRGADAKLRQGGESRAPTIGIGAHAPHQTPPTLTPRIKSGASVPPHEGEGGVMWRHARKNL